MKEYLVKGYVMDDERLKNPPVAGSAVPVSNSAQIFPYYDKISTL
ncbi:MAG: hypothetical protein M0Z83_10460 [Betaproteobacteria bacterium]|nr:hypothetical protein [Betaproteobacteria bacterium]